MSGNVANYGGALAIYSKYGDIQSHPYESMVFSACRFYDNKAVYSPAIDITPYTDRIDAKIGFLPVPVFIDIDLLGNYTVQKGSDNVLKRAFHINSGVFSITLFMLFSPPIAYTHE